MTSPTKLQTLQALNCKHLKGEEASGAQIANVSFLSLARSPISSLAQPVLSVLLAEVSSSAAILVIDQQVLLVPQLASAVQCSLISAKHVRPVASCQSRQVYQLPVGRQAGRQFTRAQSKKSPIQKKQGVFGFHQTQFQTAKLQAPGEAGEFPLSFCRPHWKSAQSSSRRRKSSSDEQLAQVNSNQIRSFDRINLLLAR